MSKVNVCSKDEVNLDVFYSFKLCKLVLKCLKDTVCNSVIEYCVKYQFYIVYIITCFFFLFFFTILDSYPYFSNAMLLTILSHGRSF